VSAAAASALDRSALATQATRAPSCAKSATIAFPIPDEPPVTKADFPVSRPVIDLSFGIYVM
jgi:hypothetical protein